MSRQHCLPCHARLSPSGWQLIASYCTYSDTSFLAGHEVTYQGHAGVGRPIPAPLGTLALYSAPRKTPQNVDRPGQGEDQPDLILPKKVRGTPTMYADLQFPKSSNFGSMKRRNRGDSTHTRHAIQSKDSTEYAKIKFSPKQSERAEL